MESSQLISTELNTTENEDSFDCSLYLRNFEYSNSKATDLDFREVQNENRGQVVPENKNSSEVLNANLSLINSKIS